MKNKKIALIVLLVLQCILILFIVLQMSVGRIEESMYPKEYSEFVSVYAKEFGVEENIIYTIIKTESGFDENAVSSANARGLMQITNETFAWIKSKIAANEDVTFDDLFEPELNIRFGTYLMAYCLERYDEDLKTAAAAYHSGVGLVDSLLEDEKYSENGETLSVFPYDQMSNYVNKIQNNYDAYSKLY